MKYTLMTGATGLLGGYLLRDALLAGRRMAVLVRRSRLESARQRIESVLARFEADLDRELPRPVVLEGDLSRPNAGLDSPTIRWIAENCDSVLHNAASLSFYHDDKTGEPERSNIEGTRIILDLAHDAGLKHFHHVSTAYVCGLRTGVCLESELDVGQEFGNDYERSKVAAEKLVRGADFLETTTFYRPAIIIGDSKTGYTSSFHGFFTPLKVASALVDSVDTVVDGSPVFSALGFAEQDQKNYVPVDWVSAVMVHILVDPVHHGQTYNLTPRNSVSVKTSTRVIEDALRRHLEDNPVAPRQINADVLSTLQVFREQMEVYRSYWRNDPEFDACNTLAAAPHLPCPRIDHAVLMRMAMFALESGFGWPLPAPLIPAQDLQKAFASMGWSELDADSSKSTVGLRIIGPGGGDWTLGVRSGKVCGARVGLPGPDRPTVFIATSVCRRLIDNSLALDEAVEEGRIHVELGEITPEAMEALVRTVVSAIAPQTGPQVIAANQSRRQPMRAI